MYVCLPPSEYSLSLSLALSLSLSLSLFLSLPPSPPSLSRLHLPRRLLHANIWGTPPGAWRRQGPAPGFSASAVALRLGGKRMTPAGADWPVMAPADSKTSLAEQRQAAYDGFEGRSARLWKRPWAIAPDFTPAGKFTLMVLMHRITHKGRNSDFPCLHVMQKARPRVNAGLLQA